MTKAESNPNDKCRMAAQSARGSKGPPSPLIPLPPAVARTLWPGRQERERAAGRIGGFTLIELLVVIAVIALLAAMIIPITGKVTQMRIRNRAFAEMENIVTDIESYKAKYGFYPPDNPGYPSTNQLFFELVGTVFNPTNRVFVTKDGSAQVAAAVIPAVLQSGVAGFMNCTRGAASDEGQQAETFLRNLKPSQK